MSAEIVGEYTVGECIPIGVAAKAALDVSLGLQLPELQAKLAGLLEIQASLTLTPPSLAASLSAALALVASLEASIALGLPSASIDLSVIAGIIAELNIFLGQLNAQLALSLGFGVTFGTPGVHLLKAEGPIEDIGSELAPLIQSLAGSGATGHALVLVATEPGVWAALQQALKTS
jgi:hypothetical protein